jgi:Predicted xylanase/chitin deacetylase
MKNTIPIIAAAILLGAAAAAIFAPSGGIGRAIPVLMYHNVESNPANVWAVSTEEFKMQMAALKKQGYTSVLPEDLRGGLFRRLPKKPIVLTFDDGFLGCLENAEPILKEHGFRGIIYVIDSFTAETPAERKTFDGRECLSWQEIRGMQARGAFAFGIHSFDHSKDKRREAAELWRCRYNFKDKTGVKTFDYCYPYGGAPDYLVDEVRKRKYKTGMICADKLFTIAKDTDWLKIPRVSVYGGKHDFKVVPSGAVEDGIFSAKITNNGVPLPMKIILRSKDADIAWKQEHPAIHRIGATGLVCSWRDIPEHLAPEMLAVELWEQNGLWRYW